MSKWDKHKEKKQKQREKTDFYKTISRNDKKNVEEYTDFSDCRTIFVENRIALLTCRAV
jgi:hypothetical protein